MWSWKIRGFSLRHISLLYRVGWFRRIQPGKTSQFLQTGADIFAGGCRNPQSVAPWLEDADMVFFKTSSIWAIQPCERISLFPLSTSRYYPCWGCIEGPFIAGSQALYYSYSGWWGAFRFSEIEKLSRLTMTSVMVLLWPRCSRHSWFNRLSWICIRQTSRLPRLNSAWAKKFLPWLRNKRYQGFSNLNKQGDKHRHFSKPLSRVWKSDLVDCLGSVNPWP